MAFTGNLEVVLVTGGCGLLGSKLVKALLSEQTCTSVHVVSRNPTANLHENANYHSGDLTSIQRMTALLNEIKPKVIFHLASAHYLAPSNEIWRTNVIGTRVLLKAVAASSSVKTIVYTSTESAIVPVEPGVSLTEETAKLYNENSKTDAYSKTKAICDVEVRAANNPPTLLTTVLRIPTLYGDKGDRLITTMLKTVLKGQGHIQIGHGKLQYEFLYDEKAIEVHILAAKALIRESTTIVEHQEEQENKRTVNGEAFFISDGISLPLFDFARKVYSIAGQPVAEEEIKVMPLWFMIPLAAFLEWLYWIFSLGKKTPELRKLDMEHLKYSIMFKIDKAKAVLGYQPVENRDEVLKMCVESCMEDLKMPGAN